MNTLFRLLRTGLEEADAGINVRGGKGYALRRGKLHVTVADRFVRTDMGMFATIGDAPASDEITEEEEDEDAGEDDDEPALDRAQVSITPDSRFLGIRAVLYDRSLKEPLTFTPVVIAGVLASFSLRARGQQDRKTSFVTARSNVKKLVKLLDSGTSGDAPISTRSLDMNSLLVSAQFKVPLASLVSEADVQEFIDAVVDD